MRNNPEIMTSIMLCRDAYKEMLQKVTPWQDGSTAVNSAGAAAQAFCIGWNSGSCSGHVECSMLRQEYTHIVLADAL